MDISKIKIIKFQMDTFIYDLYITKYIIKYI